ncbi:Glutathione S-transferase, domain-containing protein [Cladophialophora immunda]|nr:Glutathione S-transferase, domain-containing protein [Cladophialophora immunda]
MASTLKPLLLHAHHNGPNPIKISIALEFLGVPYGIRLWEGGDDPEKGVKGTAFTKINENGRVPALEDPNTGVVSWESGAVMNYIRRVYDKENKIGPRGDTEQDRVDLEKWEYLLLTTLGPMSGQCNWFRFHNKAKNEDALERYQGQTLRCYDILEGQLKKSNGETIIPGGYTSVDCHYEPWIRLHGFAGLTLDKHPLIAKWFNAFGETKEVKAAYEKIKRAAGQIE